MQGCRADGHRAGGIRCKAGALLLVGIAALFFVTARLDAQETGQTGKPEVVAGTPIPKTLLPAGTAKANASVPARLKRMAITGAGTFPFALFYTNLIFDSIRFAGNDFQTQYAPWPFKNQFSAAVDTGEKFLRLGVSIGASAMVGMLDALIQRRQ